jgi:hypothetical protein
MGNLLWLVVVDGLKETIAFRFVKTIALFLVLNQLKQFSLTPFDLDAFGGSNHQRVTVACHFSPLPTTCAQLSLP